MRILVASDRIGALSSRRAGELIATGWPDADIWVVPVGEAGPGFVEAYADSTGGRLETVADADGVATVAHSASGSAVAWEPAVRGAGGIAYGASSYAWGRSLRTVLERGPERVYVDLTGPVVHDAGAGALAALGVVGDAPLDQGPEALRELTGLELAPVQTLLDGVELVGVVPEAELSAMLLGLRGITSRIGRDTGEDTARLLTTDAALERYASLVGPQVARAPGSGACGGLGFAVLALGGRLVTGPSVTLSSSTPDGSSGSSRSSRQSRPELVLTACSVFDFIRRGGGVVAEAARLATAALAPCVVLAGEVFVGSREMRTMGIEAAYAVRQEPGEQAPGEPPPGEPPPGEPAPGGHGPGEDELRALAHRVARTWRW